MNEALRTATEVCRPYCACPSASQLFAWLEIARSSLKLGIVKQDYIMVIHIPTSDSIYFFASLLVRYCHVCRLSSGECYYDAWCITISFYVRLEHDVSFLQERQRTSGGSMTVPPQSPPARFFYAEERAVPSEFIPSSFRMRSSSGNSLSLRPRPLTVYST